MVRTTKAEAQAWYQQYEAAKQEHAVNKARLAAGKQPLPSPNIEAMKERQQMSTSTKSTKSSGGSGAGRSVRLDDTALRVKVRELIAEGYTTKGSIVKRLREIDLGTNDKRVGAAFADVVAKDGAPPKAEKVAKATPAPAKKAAAPKLTGAAKKAAANKRAATPRPKKQTPKAKGAATAAPSKLAPKTSPVLKGGATVTDIGTAKHAAEAAANA